MSDKIDVLEILKVMADANEVSGLRAIMVQSAAMPSRVTVSIALRDAAEARIVLADLIEALSEEHGGDHYDSECSICVAISRIGAAP